MGHGANITAAAAVGGHSRRCLHYGSTLYGSRRQRASGTNLIRLDITPTLAGSPPGGDVGDPSQVMGWRPAGVDHRMRVFCDWTTRPSGPVAPPPAWVGWGEEGHGG